MRVRHIVFLLFLTGFCVNSFAQSNPFGVSYKGLFLNNIEDGPLSDLYDRDKTSTRGVQVSYRKNYNNWFSMDIPLRLGTVEVRDDISNRIRARQFLGIDGYAVAGINPLKYAFGPYAFAGVGVDYQSFGNDFNLYVPAGFGVNVKLLRELWFNAEIQRRTSLLSNENTHYQMALGVVFNLNLPEEEVEETKLNMPALDADGDGVPDTEDLCPSIAGKAMFRGCPDSDNDGIIDSKDKCPNEAGPIATDGCPVKAPNGGMDDMQDSDGDGVSDQNDNCPNLAGDPATFGCPSDDADKDGVVDALDNCPSKPGLPRFGGCPDSDADGISDDKDACPSIVGLPRFAGCPDTDGDGITDASDNCPTTAGKPEFNGCPNPSAPPAPVITSPAPPVIISSTATEILADASQKVEFETSRATLRSSSYQVLDKIVSIMQQYPSYNLEVAGHTDSIGDSAGNQKLSENRAKSCRDYLVRKGIAASRINHIGYGEKQPIADNRYMAGRTKNRRVEFRLIPR